ncbi:MAG: hypothetical protein NUV32_08935 [Exilispira sp.]|jgi:hypothetical protein|nr:hypothetical protein [Exilispira sp.]
MKIQKTKAIELINEKIEQFENVAKKATYENRYNEDYELAYHGTETLLTELFSQEEAMNFRRNVTVGIAVAGGEIDLAEEVRDYKDHIGKCVAQLKVYRERIQNFWHTDEVETTTRTSILPFVSMSFDEPDQDINQYVTGILNALQIDFETGERYSKDSIPEKVQSRIRTSDLFIIILVKRDKIEGGGYTTPSWLLKELGIAQGARKDVIAWVERDIKDIAGLDYEKEVIYFERNNVKEIEKATIKFIEALKEHELI